MTAKQHFRYSVLYWTARLIHWWHHREPSFLYNRRFNPWPVICSCCDWIGRRRNALHGWRQTGEDGEPVDRCPKCGQEI